MRLQTQQRKVMADGIAKKKDPQKWAAAKSKAKARMGGKHSARAMQLATKIYKDGGGKYEGKKPRRQIQQDEEVD